MNEFNVQNFDYKEFYKKFTSPTDHWNQPEHHPRLKEAGRLVIKHIGKHKSVADFGCGNGGLLKHLSEQLPKVKVWGYDLQQPNVDYAVHVHGLDVKNTDFLTQKVKYPDVIIFTETLEHLPNPHEYLSSIKNKVKMVIASVPAYENERFYDSGHFWVWTGDSFKQLFKDYEVVDYHIHDNFQFIVAKS